jgi:hypothetical protein
MEMDIADANIENQPRVFISYKRNIAPDEFIARKLFEELKAQNFTVFIDTEMPVGTLWADQIESELRATDFLVVLLSAHSVNSEMVKGEISTAYRLSQESNGHPKILPVRLQYQEPFKYPLSAYLDPLNWAFWETNTDTQNLVKDLTRAISGGELSIKSDIEKTDLLITKESVFIEPLPDAQPMLGKAVPLGFTPDGPQDPESQFYIERSSDVIAQQAIKAETAIITIKGPEQIGKSSLLFKILNIAQQIGKKVAFVDFQLFDKATLADNNLFYRTFCSNISYELEVEDKTEEYWGKNRNPNNTMHSTLYMEYLLKAVCDATIVLAIDQIEDLYHLEFRTEFFKMLRSWHERRGNVKYKLLWKRLNMVLVTSTEPYDLIDDDKSSPFNVGEIIKLNDFSLAHINKLNELYSFPLTQNQTGDLMNLLCGQPYLIHKTFWLVATKRITVDDLFAEAASENGPFGDHLHYHLFNLRNKPKLLTELHQIIVNKKPLDEENFHQLCGAGLMRGEFKTGEFRSPLYEEYFRRHLNA